MVVTETRPPKGYRWGEVTIQAWELAGEERVVRPAVVPALIHECGYLCLHKPVVEGFGLWTVTHVPSGQKIAILPTQAIARQCVGCLLSLPSLRDEKPSPSLRSEVEVIVSSLQSQWISTSPASGRKPSGRTRKGNPSSFSPVFHGYVPTPATRAAQNKATLVFGELWNARPEDSPTGSFASAWASLEQAAAVQWREEIVIRVTQPPRAILLETDIPQTPDSSPTPSGANSPQATARPFSGVTLRDGTPATPGEFRRRYQHLMDLGDRLRAGSLKFQTLYREGERDGWTTERLDRWEKIDERFKALVFEGWMVWSGAALCLDVAPPEFQRNVVAKLGYVGSRERGWHELAMKSLLRHPEIEAVLPLRRDVREKIGARL
jgi:hypothetical protein